MEPQENWPIDFQKFKTKSVCDRRRTDWRKASRGANLNEVQVHSVRLPGHVISIETIFGLKDEKLSIRHDSGASAEPYVKADF